MGRHKTFSVVLTGGPGSGKTTLLNKLRKANYATVDESAGIVLKFMASFLGSDQAQADWRRSTSNHIDWLQDKILRVSAIQMEIAEKLGPKDVLFLDRGIHDSLTYFKIHNRKVPRALSLACKEAQYDLIIVLETPPQKYFAPKAGRNTTLRGDSVAMGKLLFDLYNKYFPGKTVFLPWSGNRTAAVLKIVKGFQETFSLFGSK